MFSRIIMAGMHYHETYPGTIIFYRISDCYVAFQGDADKVAGVLSKQVLYADNGIRWVGICCSDLLSVIGDLAAHGLKAKAVTGYDEDGNHTIPDIEELKNSCKLDY